MVPSTVTRQVGVAAFLARRPALSGCGAAAPDSGSTSSSATGTDNTRAIASSVVIVTFSEPRSTRPVYARSIPAASASRSWEKPRSTRSERMFQPMILRASMTHEDQKRGSTIDGLIVLYYGKPSRALRHLRGSGR